MAADIQDEPTQFHFPVTAKLACFVMMAVGGITFGLSFLGGSELAFTGWTIAAWYCVGLSLFAGFFISINHLSGGGWYTVFKRVPEAMLMYLPVALLTFVVLALSLGTHFYEWAHPHDHGDLHSALIDHKRPWLNAPFFLVRMALYFAIWVTFAWMLRRHSIQQDADGEVRHTLLSRRWAAGYCITFALTLTFASVDYVMSVEPVWFSTMFGVYHFAGILQSGFAATILLLLFLRSSGYLRKVVNENHFHNLGIWLLSVCVFWAYIWFCQFMLIWYVNIPETNQHYFVRWGTDNPWFWITFVVSPLVNFVIPFLTLLPRPNKRNLRILGGVALLVLLGRFLDLWQFMAPRPVHDDAHLPVASVGVGSFLVIGVTVGMLGLFAFVVLKALEKAPLIARHDPYLEESLHHHL
jgi:hypothetical protein